MRKFRKKFASMFVVKSRNKFFAIMMLLALGYIFTGVTSYGMTLYTYSQDFAPKYFIANGKIQGLCFDIAMELNKELKSAGVGIKYKSNKLYKKTQIVEALEQNEIQIAIGLGYLEEDEKKGLEYIKFPLYGVRQMFTVLKNREKELLTLKMAKIGVIQGTYPANSALKMFKNTNVVEFSSPSELILALEKKQIDAIFWCSMRHGYLLSQNAGKYGTIDYVGEKFYHYAVVNRHVPKNVKEVIYKAVRKLNENNVIQKLIDKYKLRNYALCGNVIEILAVDWKPYEWYDKKENVWKGFDVEVVENVFRKLGFKIVILTYPWERCLKFMEERKFDGTMTVAKTKEREHFLIYPEEPLSTTSDALFKLKTNPINVRQLEKIPATALCAYSAGYAYPDWFWNAPFRKEAVLDDATGFLMLKEKRVDLFVCNILVGKFLAKELGMEKDIEYSPNFGEKLNSYIAFSKNFHGAFLSGIFSDNLKKFKTTKEYESILKKYGIAYEDLWN